MAERLRDVESESQADSSRSKRRVRTAIIAGVTAVATLVGGGIAGYKMNSRNGTIADLRQDLATQTDYLAHQEAAAFTEALQDEVNYPKGVQMTVLNGVVRTFVKNGTNVHEGMYTDPILLAQLHPDQDADVEGKFLQGAWLGIQGNDADGRATITAVPFNPGTDHFESYVQNPAAIEFPHLGVYATGVTDDLKVNRQMLIGFDLTGQQMLINGDGSVITPGES